MERVTACDGDAMANWRRHDGVAFLAILHGQRDNKLINNGETASDGNAMVNWMWASQNRKRLVLNCLSKLKNTT
jgi:hypothetical protein